MIVGNGMIATAFKSYVDNEDIVIFARGVSNSQETNLKNFDREAKLLKSVLSANPSKTIVYFGTCSVLDGDSKNSLYVQHKIKMETIVKNSGLDYFIFRLPQVVGATKSPTLINFMANKIRSNSHFDIWKYSKRNLIDVEDVFRFVDYFITNGYFKNSVVNIASSQAIYVSSIVDKIESIVNKKGSYSVIERGSCYDIDISNIEPYFEEIGVNFDDTYVDRVLCKYL